MEIEFVRFRSSSISEIDLMPIFTMTQSGTVHGMIPKSEPILEVETCSLGSVFGSIIIIAPLS